MAQCMGGPFQAGRECCLRIAGVVHPVVMRGVSQDALWVSSPEGGAPAPGTGVDLEFHNDEGFKAYHALVVAVAPHGDDGVILQRVCGGMKHRRNWRVPTSIEGRLIPLPENGGTHKAYVVNLSVAGALAELPVSLPVGLQARLMFACEQGMLNTVMTKVVHDNRVLPESMLYRVGLQFTEVPREVRRNLTLYLWRRIRELYPRELRATYLPASILVERDAAPPVQ